MRPNYLPAAIILLILLVISPIQSGAQGWLAPVEPTFTTFTTGVSLGDDATTYRGSLIRTFSNSFDLSFRGEWISDDDDNILVAKPGLTLYPFRSEDDLYTLGIGGTYGRTWFTGDVADQFDSIKGQQWSVFAGIYGAIPLGGMMMVPTIEIRRFGAKVEVDDSRFGSISESAQQTEYTIGLAVVGGKTGDRYFMRPNVTIIDGGETRWNVTVGSLFGPKRTGQRSIPPRVVSVSPPSSSPPRVTKDQTTDNRRISYKALTTIRQGVSPGPIGFGSRCMTDCNSSTSTS